MKKPDNPENLNRELLVKKDALKTNEQDAAIALNELAGVAGGQADYQYEEPGFYCVRCGVRARQGGIMQTNNMLCTCPVCGRHTLEPKNDENFICLGG